MIGLYCMESSYDDGEKWYDVGMGKEVREHMQKNGLSARKIILPVPFKWLDIFFMERVSKYVWLRIRSPA